MSIATKTGDMGTTALMFNRRVSKCHPRVEAYGCVDELNAAIGLARATAEQQPLRERLLRIQNDLVQLMGELATDSQDMERYLKAGLSRVIPETTAKLDQWIQELEARQPGFHGWATPGTTQNAAALDVARTVCRRAERRGSGRTENPPATPSPARPPAIAGSRRTHRRSRPNWR